MLTLFEIKLNCNPLNCKDTQYILVIGKTVPLLSTEIKETKDFLKKTLKTSRRQIQILLVQN